ncbi:MAG TPA: type VI secretion system protein TssA [Rhodanobacteraceae bacterium]|jgi:type VI secretion system protein ImpA|nr:type VI secretion system protein TssA [Rhodanobacteraceae bacterium]
MTDFALDALLAPIDGDSPTGPDLEYDAEFMALERAAAAKAEKVMGDEVKAAEEPDWSSVIDMSLALLRRSKDLRVAVPLSVAWLRTRGMPGWCAGMGLIQGLLETYWDGVYPQLDAEDDNDPTARVNAVAPIADIKGALGYLHSTPFVQSPRLGRYNLRDLRIATGELKLSAPAESSEEGSPSTAASLTEIEACCMDCAEEELAATIEAINTSLEHVRAIDKLFSDQIGTAGPELKPLITDLQALKKFLEPQMAKRHPELAVDGDSEAEVASGNAGTAVAGNGRINGPQDVVRRIDEICDYYARAEPSSPVPLLLRRAQRLVGMTFDALMQDLAPSGVSELQVISGAPSE